MARIKLFMGLLGLAMAASSPAHAYIDPGMGSMLLQLLLGGIAGAMVVGRLYWVKLKAFFTSASSGSDAADPGGQEGPEKDGR